MAEPEPPTSSGAVDESNCLELTLAEWEARDLHRKFTETVLWPLRPLL